MKPTQFILSIGLAAFVLSFPSIQAAPPAAAIAAPGKTFAPVDDMDKPFKETTSPLLSSTEKDPNGWSFVIEPYLWALGMSGDIGVRGLPAIHVDYTAKTILQHLDWGVMARGEVRKGRWGILGDGLFAQLSADGSPPGPLYESGNAKLQQGVASLALAFRVIDDRRGFLDIYAGARYNYFNLNIGGSVDSDGIQDLSDGAAQRISNGIGRRVDAFLAANQGALAAAAVNAVGPALTERVVTSVADFPDTIRDSLSPRQIQRIVSTVQNRSGEFRELVAAVAASRLAAANNQLTQAVQNRVTQAEKRLAKALAREIEERLPTSLNGSEWWVDPIVGLRGQINFTRWLFLAVQGDVGGFGAGSQIAWNTQATIGFNITRHIFAELGYRYYYMDYQDGGFVYNAAQAGIFSGFGVKF